jgi:hypothetical protein
MPSIYFIKDGHISVSEGLKISQISEDFDGTTRIEVVSSRNKPLAQGKPAGSRAKGKPAKGGKPPRKVAHKG